MFQTNNKKGFTMVELLVVLVIIGILAAVAAPLYLANTKRAKASEAVATMSLIRQALRDYKINNNIFYNVAKDATNGNIQRALPTSVNTTTKAPTPATAGVDVDAAVAQYFSNSSYEVDAGDGTVGSIDWSTGITAANPTDPVDFVIKVNGNDSDACGSGDTNCALKEADVSTYRLNMDNAGRIFVSYDSGTTWSAY